MSIEPDTSTLRLLNGILLVGGVLLALDVFFPYVSAAGIIAVNGAELSALNPVFLCLCGAPHLGLGLLLAGSAGAALRALRAEDADDFSAGPAPLRGIGLLQVGVGLVLAIPVLGLLCSFLFLTGQLTAALQAWRGPTGAVNALSLDFGFWLALLVMVLSLGTGMVNLRGQNAADHDSI